jgi:hypothetical protein
MLKGIHLTLMIGPRVPVPVPASVIDALSEVTVDGGKDRCAFQLTFQVAKKSPLLTTMLPSGYFDPMVTRVIIAVTIAGMPNVLMDGIVTHQQMHPSSDPGKSTLIITGEDLSVLMDVVETVNPYPNVPDIARVYLLLAPYTVFGIIPLAIPPIMKLVKASTKGYETKTAMTDRAYLKELARRNGYVFFVRPGPFLKKSVAYFGPDVNLPIPQPALSVNMDADTNVETLSFSLNGLEKSVTLYLIGDPATKKIPIPIPVPNVSVFKPPLGKRWPLPAKLKLANNGAKLLFAEAARDLLGTLMRDEPSITGEGSLDVLRYGHVLQWGMLVGVRGAGAAYDGLYYVDSVSNTIKHGEFKQNFKLSRDGTMARKQKVAV